MFSYVTLTLIVCSYMQTEVAGYEKLPNGDGCCPFTGCSACTSNMVERSIPRDSSHISAKKICTEAATFRRMCTKAEMCRNGLVAGGTKTGQDIWVPVSDDTNTWVQAGDNPHLPCSGGEKTQDYFTKRISYPWKQVVFCCSEILLPNISLRNVIDNYQSTACSVTKLPSDCTSWKFVANALTSGKSSSVEKSPYGVYRLANSDNLATSTNNMYVHDKFWSVSSTIAPETIAPIENYNSITHWFTNGLTEETYPKCSMTENGWTDMWSVSAAKICKEGGQCDHENVVSGHCNGKGGWVMWHQAKPYPGNLCMTGTDISPCKFTGELKYIHACMAATCSSKKDAIVALHGSIENWDVSEVTTMANAFRGMVNFNSDIR